MLCSIQTRLALAACVFLLVTACGGGGGGGGGSGSSSGGGSGGSSNANDPSFTIDTRTFALDVSSWDAGQSKTALLTVTNMPATGAWIDIDSTNNGVAYADFTGTTNITANLVIQFKPGAQLMPGTYRDTITVSVCADDQCGTQFRNSPMTITTTLVVSGESSVSPVEGPVTATASKRVQSQTLPTASTAVTIGNPGPVAPYVMIASTSELLDNVTPVVESNARVRLDATFKSPINLQPGDRTENVQLKVCYDSSCARQLTGSPITLPVSYHVTNDALAEQGVDPLEFLSRTSLPHDVIDGEYSKALESIVMVSAYPRNSLYLFDMATLTERELPLNKAPMSVSVSPDGTHAAVGHDALVSVVDLSQLQQTGATVPVILNVSTAAFDIVLDGHGYVHVFPLTDQWVNLHSIEIATNTETLGTGRSIYAGEHGRLHPSGDFIYGANNGLSPSDIEKFDVSGGAATYLYDSPYHGDYGMCGDLWFKDDGTTVYTRCGNTFRTSTTQAQDMVYSGKLQLSSSQYYAYLITSLSQSSATKEIALIETDNSCFSGSDADCYSHLAVYESDFLNRLSVRSLAPVPVAGTAYAQRGMLVFHSADGQHRYMISRLLEMPDPAAEFYVTVVN
jgi:hypothetical protein